MTDNFSTGLFGKKLSHSLSPQIHKLICGADYRLFQVSEEQVPHFVSTAKLEGFNVTVPYKKTVMPLMDTLSPTAIRTGAVNTAVRKNGLLHGYNTDVFGFTQMLLHHGFEVQNKLCVILGSGGASAAVRVALEDMGAGQIVTVSRTGETTYEDLYSMPRIDLLINATPVGMFPNDTSSPVDLSRLNYVGGVADLIYNPLETPLLFKARQLNIKAADGLYMLVAQAVKSCELFYSHPFPESITDRVYEKILGDFRNTVLIGMPSCGKTFFGKRLAQRLNRPFVDTDELLAEGLGSTPEQIINAKGEEFFRKAEAEIIRGISQNHGTVISVGGGAVCTPENIESLRKNSLVIFLDRPIEELTESSRPLSKQYGIENLYLARLPLYKKCAHVTVRVTTEEATLESLTEYAKKPEEYPL